MVLQRVLVFLLLVAVPGVLVASPVAGNDDSSTPVAELINVGLKVLAVGMLGVFAFLIIMVAVISLMAALFKNFGRSGHSETEDGVPRSHVAAISAAVSSWLRSNQHR